MTEDANAYGKVRLNTETIKGKRYYEVPGTGELVPSVTTFLNVLPKPALETWKRKQIATWAVEHKDDWARLPDEAAIGVVEKSMFYNSTAAASGDVVHGIFEGKALGRDPHVPPGFEPVLEQWDRFNQDFEVEVLGSEVMLYNDNLKYAGSADLIVSINGEVGVLDFKSGNGLYGSTAFQCRAYGLCPYKVTNIGVVDTGWQATKAWGFWSRPAGYALFELDQGSEVTTAVRAARALFDVTADDWKYRGKALNPGPIRSKGVSWPVV